jgi:hypothetical protein
MSQSRRAEAEMIAEQATIEDWLRLIRSEYMEIPGLHLTKTQVRRLWNLDPVMCEALLESLLETGFLRQTGTGAYVRADDGGR